MPDAKPISTGMYLRSDLTGATWGHFTCRAFTTDAAYVHNTDMRRIGAESILRAFWRDDFPEDPEQIFLTSWGEWWPKDVYKVSLDHALWDKWSPSKEQIEEEEGISS